MSEPVGVRIEAVDWLDPRAVALREAMDAETSAMYAEFAVAQSARVRAGIDAALRVHPEEFLATLIAVHEQTPIGHAALRPAPGVEGALEVKKVFVAPDHRGTGVSRMLMGELEQIARGRAAARLVLQTGRLQEPAIALYEGIGYRAIDPYGPYDAVPGALCFEKVLA